MKRCRLIYRSIASPEVLTEDALAELEEKCIMNNERAGICGLLLLSGDRFLQVLEGPVLLVNSLLRKIIVDPRHHDFELISFESLGTSYFFDWSMRTVRLDQLSDEMHELFTRKYTYDDGKLLIPDNELLVYSLLLDARTVCHEMDG